MEFRLFFVIVAALSVEGSPTKRMNEGWQNAWVYIGKETVQHYLGYYVPNIGDMVEQPLKECLAKEGEEGECMKGKSRELCAKLQSQPLCDGMNNILYGLFAIGTIITGDCHDVPEEQIKTCADNAIASRGVCCNAKPFPGYDKCFEEFDWECLYFLWVMEQKSIEYHKSQPKARIFSADRLRSLSGRTFTSHYFKR